MYAHVFDINSLAPVANLINLLDASCSLRHNESGQALLTVLADSPEITPLLTTANNFDIEKMLQAPMLWMAHVRDQQGRLRMQGRLTIQPSGDDRYMVVVSDLLDELRLICLPPQLFLNGLVVDILTSILSYMPPSNRRMDLAYPTSTVLVGERWILADTKDAVNAWTTIDAGRMSCMEALLSVCEATGNNICLSPDGSRSIRVYAEPVGEPVANLVQGGLHARQPARYTMTLIGQPGMVVEDETVIAGVIPEGGSYTTEDNINRVLRLTGDEYVPSGYRLENLNGYWGVFSESMVGTPANATLPKGQIRCEAFGNITPVVNTYESISAVVEETSDIVIRSAALAGYAPNHWKDGVASFGEQEAGIVASGGNSITLASPLSAMVGDIISIEVFREWRADIVADSQQSLAGASVALLENSQKVLISWQVRIRNSDIALSPGDYVRLIYSGGVQVQGWQGSTVRFLPTVNLSQVFVISGIEIMQENGEEYLDLTLTERLWRFPSGSGLRELMALIQRRMPGVRMGREGSAYIEA